MEENENKEQLMSGLAKSVNEAKSRGVSRATVEQSANLLKNLSQLNSKKDDILKRLSEISNKMQSKLNEENGDMPSDVIEEPRHLHGGLDYHTHFHSHDNLISPVNKVAFTRTRETKAPLFNVSYIWVFVPKSLAMNTEWKSNLDSSDIEFSDDGFTVPASSCVSILTGIRFAVPEKCLFLIESANKDFEVVSPTTINKDDNGELTVVVRNWTSNSSKLKCDEPLLKICIKSAAFEETASQQHHSILSQTFFLIVY